MTTEEILKAEPHELAKRAKVLDRKIDEASITDVDIKELNLIKDQYYKLTHRRLTAKTLMYV